MTATTRLFLDTEFTGLHQQARLISLGLCSEAGDAFYAEFADIDPAACDPWIQEQVLPHCRWLGRGVAAPQRTDEDGVTGLFAAPEQVTAELTAWLGRWRPIEVWADCLAYDWVLFCELFGGALALPDNVFYMPFDLATVFKLRGLDPDTDRVGFAGLDGAPQRHNALWDARLAMACYRRLMAQGATGD